MDNKDQIKIGMSLIGILSVLLLVTLVKIFDWQRLSYDVKYTYDDRVREGSTKLVF